MKYTKRATIIILTLIALAAEIAAQGSRIMLTQLERAPSISGSRKGMIGLSNANGDQRYAFYVNVADTCINYTPSDTGNATVSIFVQKCATDSIWYIDYEGRSILLAPYGAASDTCDVDWLEIADNNCPDNLNDSIYKYKYASIGARYVWPGAELLVNDSVASGIAVVQGSRNARLALYDSQSPGTFFMIDHGGSAPVMYMPVNANLVFKTTAGTPQTPVGSQVNHFAINTQDSTIQMYRYPNTRTDTQSVVNFLYTDPVGKVRSRPITYVVDSIGLGENIYNSNGTIPPDINRIVNIDTSSGIRFRYPNSVNALYLYSGDDSTGTGSVSSLGIRNDNNDIERYVGFTDDLSGLYISQGNDTLALPGQLLVAGEDGTFEFARPDTISGLNSNIYNSNGTIGADLTRTVRLDTATSVVFENTLTNEIITIYSGDDSTTVNGFISISSPDSENTIEINDDRISAIVPYTEFLAGDFNNSNTGTGIQLDLSNEIFRAGDVFADDLHGFLFNGDDNYTAMYYGSLAGSFVHLGSNQTYEEGQDVGIGWTDGYGLWIASQNQTEVIRQNSQEFEMYGGTYSGYLITGDTAGQVAIYGRNTPEDRQAFLNVDGNASGDGYARATLAAYDSNAPEYTLAEIILDTSGVGINTRGGLGNDGDVLTSNGSRAYWAPASGGTNIYNSDGTIEENVQRNVQIDSLSEVNFLYADGDEAINIYAGDDVSATSAKVQISSPDGDSYFIVDDNGAYSQYATPNGAFYAISEDTKNYIIQGNEFVQIIGGGTTATPSQYSFNGDTTGFAEVKAINASDSRFASLRVWQNNTGEGASAQMVLGAYDPDADNTETEIRIDTAGVTIYTKGSDGDAGQVLQADGNGKTEWGVVIEDGIIGADMLSYNNLVGWETVNANRALMATTGGGSTPTLTPSVGVTEIIVTDTATTSTVNLNYVPGELDGASFAQPFTTVRYIYNWGSGDCTVDTNQDWTFRVQGDGTGNTTLTIPTGQSYKLVWVQGSSEATSSFWCFRIN